MQDVSSRRHVARATSGMGEIPDKFWYLELELAPLTRIRPRPP